MTTHPQSNPNPAGPACSEALLVELAAGGLRDSEAGQVLEHLKSCESCRERFARTDLMTRELLETEDIGPSDRAWDLIEQGLEGESPSAAEGDPAAADLEQALQPWKIWSANSGSAIQRQVAKDGWSRTGIPGLEVRELSTDLELECVTMIVRMAPGARYPAHQHGGPEECLVLEGDLQIGPESMGAGDFQRMATGSKHVEQWTEGGCLLFLRSSTRDVMVG